MGGATAVGATGEAGTWLSNPAPDGATLAIIDDIAELAAEY